LPRPFLHGVAPYARVEIMPRANDNSFWRTNLARTRTDASQQIAGTVQRVWLSHLLEAVDQLPPLGRFETPQQLGWMPLGECRWLQKFDAETIYKLGRRLWVSEMEKDDSITEWEAGIKGDIYLGWPELLLHHQLLALVLPRVCGRIFGRNGTFQYGKLHTDWRKTLKGWKTYIDEKTTWDTFATYQLDIHAYLFWSYAGENVLNERYWPLLEHAPFALEELPKIFRNLLHSTHFGKQTRLSREQRGMLQWIGRTVPEAQIGDLYNSVLLRSVAPPPTGD
jgi:hypothetical protein